MGLMALFAVVALKSSSVAIDEAVGRTPPTDSYKIEDGKWFVNADVTTARELAIKLGLRGTPMTYLVLPVRGYSGNGSPDMWEWLAAQSAKADG